MIVAAHVLAGQVFGLVQFHVGLSALFGMIYYLSPSTRRLPPWLRVHPIAFLPMAVLMPVAYLLLTPLGLFTLDTASWETRGHGAVAAAAAPPGGPR